MKNLKKTVLIIATLAVLPARFVLASEPELETLPATNITQTSAVLNASIQEFGGQPLISAGFEYGLTNIYGSSVPANLGYEEGEDIISLPTGSGSNFLNANGKIALDSLGNIYVADTNNYQIKKFDNQGNYLLSFGQEVTDPWGESIPGEFTFLQGIATDSFNNVYVANNWQWGSSIQKFDPNGQFISYLVPEGILDFTAGGYIFFDSEDNLYSIERNSFLSNTGVKKFNTEGDLIMEFGEVGFEDGQLVTPMAGSIDSDGNIYILDEYNYSIKKFNSSGQFLLEFTHPLGSLPGELYNPSDIAIDYFNNIYVSDLSNHRIQKFNQSGVFQEEFYTEMYSYDIEFDSENNFYVFTKNYDTGIHKVKKFSLEISPTTITNLRCGKTYNFRVFGANNDGVGYGENMTFITSNCRLNTKPNIEVDPVKPGKPIVRPDVEIGPNKTGKPIIKPNSNKNESENIPATQIKGKER